MNYEHVPQESDLFYRRENLKNIHKQNNHTFKLELPYFTIIEKCNLHMHTTLLYLIKNMMIKIKQAYIKTVTEAYYDTTPKSKLIIDRHLNLIISYPFY